MSRARVIPAVSLLVPWYYVFSNLRMVGGFTVLVLSHMFVSLPLIVYIMMGYFDGLPLELEESAMVDGLTPIGAFRRITLPLSTPGIATAGILSFIFSWNNFMFALVLSSADTKTLPVAIFDFVGYASIDWGGLMAASTVVTLPIMLIALFAQKYVVSGLTAADFEVWQGRKKLPVTGFEALDLNRLPAGDERWKSPQAISARCRIQSAEVSWPATSRLPPACPTSRITPGACLPCRALVTQVA